MSLANKDHYTPIIQDVFLRAVDNELQIDEAIGELLKLGLQQISAIKTGVIRQMVDEPYSTITCIMGVRSVSVAVYPGKEHRALYEAMEFAQNPKRNLKYVNFVGKLKRRKQHGR